jgi:hypothetical protein
MNFETFVPTIDDIESKDYQHGSNSGHLTSKCKQMFNKNNIIWIQLLFILLGQWLGEHGFDQTVRLTCVGKTKRPVL